MGILGFVYNLSQYWMISYTSAHYAALIGNLKVLLLVMISMMIFHTKLNPINYVGISISLVGFCLYNFFRYQELKRARETLQQLENAQELASLKTIDKEIDG
jgi:drug/metabolite transporter (DMT)-like permease